MAEAWFFLVSLVYVCAAVVVAFGISRFMDNRLGIHFKTDVLPAITSRPIAAGLYFGLRWFGVCWLVAQALS